MMGAKFGLGLEDLNLGPIKLGKGFLGIKNASTGTVGVAPRSQNIQVVMPQMRSRLDAQGNQIDVLCGTEYIASVSSGASGNLAGDILEAILVSPSSLLQTRLNQFAPLYQRYRFAKLAFYYEPTANATQSGQLIGFTDYDVDAPLQGNSADNVSIAAAHLGQAVCQIWEGQTFPFGVVDDLPMLYTSLEGEEDRLIYQGLFYLLAATSLGNDLPLGNLYIAYECEFSVPQLAPSLVPASVLMTYQVGPASGTTATLPFGTTGVTDHTADFGSVTGWPVTKAVTVAYSTVGGTGSRFIVTGLPVNTWFVALFDTGAYTYNCTTAGQLQPQINLGGDANTGQPDPVGMPSFVSYGVSSTGNQSSLITAKFFQTTNEVVNGFVNLTCVIANTTGVVSTTLNPLVNPADFLLMSIGSVNPSTLPTLLSDVWKNRRGPTLKRISRQLALETGRVSKLKASGLLPSPTSTRPKEKDPLDKSRADEEEEETIHQEGNPPADAYADNDRDSLRQGFAQMGFPREKSSGSPSRDRSGYARYL